MKRELLQIRNLNFEELSLRLSEYGEPAYRARQVYEWIWKKCAMSFDEMSNLPKLLRNKLSEEFAMNALQIDAEQKSSDGTIKCRFKLHDGNFIEGVLIPDKERFTACVSSQVGCSLACNFCATGFLKLKRNLEPYEIFDQVVLLNKLSLKHYEKPLSNIVFMGMGEPLLNYKNVLAAIGKITGEDGLHISSRRITLSTAGIAKMIKKLGDDNVKFNLALSLHAADDLKRSALMPINDSNNLDALMESLSYFYEKTKNKITFEYILFNGINETEKDAKNLVSLCRNINAKVNIIEYNPIREAQYQKSKEEQREKFIEYLSDNGVIAKVRRSRGKDIDAACGQLANISSNNFVK